MKYLLALLFCASAFGADIGELSRRDAGLAGRWLDAGFTNPQRAFDPKAISRTGSVVNAVGPVFLNGRQAVNFNGTNQRITFVDTNICNLANFTVSAWALGATNFSTGLRILITKGSAAFSNSWGVAEALSDAGKLTFWSGGWGYQAKSAVLSSNTWYHLVGVCTSSNLTLYVNGKLAGTVSRPAADLRSPINLSIGSSTTPNRYWYGAISNIRVVETSYSAAEVAAIYKEELR